eukprot:3677452-Rhodomonas_salina.2
MVGGGSSGECGDRERSHVMPMGACEVALHVEGESRESGMGVWGWAGRRSATAVLGVVLCVGVLAVAWEGDGPREVVLAQQGGRYYLLRHSLCDARD